MTEETHWHHRVRPQLRPPSRPHCPSAPSPEPPTGGCGEHPAPPAAPSGLGQAGEGVASRPSWARLRPGHPGRASLTGPAGAAWSSQRPTLQRRSLCRYATANRVIVATRDLPSDGQQELPAKRVLRGDSH
jgi:hypothetical protein